MANKKINNDQDNMPSFEGNVENLIRSSRLRNLYDSPKWENPHMHGDKVKGRKPRNKNHRGC